LLSKKTARMGDKAKPLSVGSAGGFAVSGQALEVRPQNKDDSAAEERQQQREAEIVFCPVHVSELSGCRASR
jgi:hypothetical protein